MARSQEQRNRAAQARLRALGVDAPLKGAEYRLRVEQGLRAGRTREEAAGHRVRREVRQAQARARSATRRLKGGGQRAVKMNGWVTVTTTTDMGDVARSIAKARRAGAPVILRAIVQTDQGPRTITLGDGKSGKRIPTGVVVPPLSVTVVQYDAGSGLLRAGEGLKPADLAGAGPEDDGWWFDMIDAEYEEGDYS